MEIKTFGVVGSGQMGSGIALVAAMSGMKVLMNDIFEECVERGYRSIERHLERGIEKGKITEAERNACLERIQTSVALKDMAGADFVVVLYNPKSKKRTWQLERAQQILLQYRDKNTPTGIVVSAMRENQDVQVVALEKLHEAHVNMQTTVFVGNSTSSRYLNFMVTPRGYAQKYGMGEKTENHQ